MIGQGIRMKLSGSKLLLAWGDRSGVTGYEAVTTSLVQGGFVVEYEGSCFWAFQTFSKEKYSRPIAASQQLKRFTEKVAKEERRYDIESLEDDTKGIHLGAITLKAGKLDREDVQKILNFFVRVFVERRK